MGSFLLNIYAIYSQDTIVKVDNEQIICKILEISTDEIKYQLENTDIIIGVDKNEVSKVMLSTGALMTFKNSLYDEANYKYQRKNALKVGFFSPLLGFTDISYEKSLKPGSSIEFTLGIIGLGKDNGEDLAGASFKAGYKFIKSPDFYLKGLRYAHLLKGL